MRCFLGQKWLGFRSRETTWWLHRIMRCKRVENIPPNLSEANNKMLRSLWTRIFITENNLNILHKSMKRQKFGKNYLFTTKFKGNSLMSNSLMSIRFSVGVPLLDMTGKPVISNSGTPTEKGSECLNHHLKKGHTKRMVLYSVFKRFKKHILGTQKCGFGDGDAVCCGLGSLQVCFERKDEETIQTKELLKIAELMLKTVSFLNLAKKEKNKFLEQLLRRNFSHHEIAFSWIILKLNCLRFSVYNLWFPYTVDMFFIWTYGEESR